MTTPGHAPSGRPRAGGLAVAVLAAAAGGGLALWAFGQEWTSVPVPRPVPLPPDARTQTGGQLVPWAPALAFVAVAGGIALLAVRRVGRVVVSLVLVAAGAGLVVGGAIGLDGGLAGGAVAAHWPALSLFGGVLVAAAGTLGLARGSGWARMGARYESPTARAAVPAQDAAGVWDALDRGDDPTARN